MNLIAIRSATFPKFHIKVGKIYKVGNEEGDLSNYDAAILTGIGVAVEKPLMGPFTVSPKSFEYMLARTLDPILWLQTQIEKEGV